LQNEIDLFEICDNYGNDTCDNDGNDAELNDLILRVQTGRSCSVQELISGEDDIPVCRELENDNWDEAFITELGPALKKLPTDEDDDSIEICSEKVDNTEVEHMHTTIHTIFTRIVAQGYYYFFTQKQG